MVGSSTNIYKFNTIFVNHVIPECSIPQHMASWVSSYATGVEDCCNDCATMSNESLPVELPCWSLSRFRVSLIINVDDPQYPLHAPSDLSRNDIIISTSSQIRPLMTYQATPSLYRNLNAFVSSFSYIVCRWGDPNTSFFSWWFLQAHYVSKM